MVLLENYLEKTEERPTTAKNSISLFGYPESEEQKQLALLLEGKGVRINTSFIPSVDMRLLPLMYRSERFVFSPNHFQGEIFEHPFQTMGIPWISPRFPYSFRYTDEWLRAIFAEFHFPFEENDTIRDFRKKYEAKTAYVKERGFTV